MDWRWGVEKGLLAPVIGGSVGGVPATACRSNRYPFAISFCASANLQTVRWSSGGGIAMSSWELSILTPS